MARATTRSVLRALEQEKVWLPFEVNPTLPTCATTDRVLCAWTGVEGGGAGGATREGEARKDLTTNK